MLAIFGLVHTRSYQYLSYCNARMGHGKIGNENRKTFLQLLLFIDNTFAFHLRTLSSYLDTYVIYIHLTCISK